MKQKKAAPAKPVRRRPQRIMFRVLKARMVDPEAGVLVPVDAAARVMMRDKGYRMGDEILAELRKPRNPKFWRLGHALGALLIQNVEEFSHYNNAHAVLKRLQLESGVACDSIAMRGEFGILEHRVPLSLAFADMDEGTWRETYKGLCKHIRKRYWPTMTDEEVTKAAEEMMVDPT